MQKTKIILALVCLVMVLGTSSLRAQMYQKGQQDLHLGCVLNKI